jgi:DNA-binding protein H-NS
MAHLRTLGLPVALAAAFSVPPLAAQEGGTSDTGRKAAPPDAASLEKTIRDAVEKGTRDALDKALKDVSARLDRIEGAVGKRLDDLEAEAKVQRQEINLRRQESSATREEIDQLRRRVSKLEDQLNQQTSRAEGLTNELSELRKKLAQMDGSVMPRVAAYFPSVEKGTAVLRLHNTSDRPVSVIVNNGRSQRLEPNESMTVPPVPAGSVTYEVLGLGSDYRKTKTLAAGETLDVEVHDPVRGPRRLPIR